MESGEGTEFSFFISSLAMQASIALGSIAHPITGKVEPNLPHAKLIIDTLAMLKEKTAGNLTTDEDSLLDKFLYGLRQQYEKHPGRAGDPNKEGAQ
ncbi:MAG: DUF1844 domain-containing protein [Candidatus Omnitrophica bacterium]|nr:DUF1844 domain-containing protein [Candidatus Omnitrophota bacterium]